MRIKDIVMIGMLGALLIAVQVGLAFLPNVELVSLLIIVYTMVLRKKALYIIGIFIILEGFIYGFGLWWINYLYVWFVLFILVTIFHNKTSPFFWGVLSGIFGLAFGALCAIPYLFIGSVNGDLLSGLHMALAYWIGGIPFDIAHGIANFIIAIILFQPLYSILNILSNTEQELLC